MPEQPTPLRPLPVAGDERALRRMQPIEKAALLMAEDRVRLDADAQVYPVSGDHGTYKVIVDEEGIFCPCPARTTLCAHAIAVALIRQRGKHVPGRLVKDLGVAS